MENFIYNIKINSHEVEDAIKELSKELEHSIESLGYMKKHHNPKTAAQKLLSKMLKDSTNFSITYLKATIKKLEEFKA